MRADAHANGERSALPHVLAARTAIALLQPVSRLRTPTRHQCHRLGAGPPARATRQRTGAQVGGGAGGGGDGRWWAGGRDWAWACLSSGRACAFLSRAPPAASRAAAAPAPPVAAHVPPPTPLGGHRGGRGGGRGGGAGGDYRDRQLCDEEHRHLSRGVAAARCSWSRRASGGSPDSSSNEPHPPTSPDGDTH